MAHIKNIKNTKPFSLLSFVLLVITSVVGADIYVIITQTTRLSGILSIWAWIICGVIALIIGLCFAECANLVSENGGTFIYAEKAFGKFAGFLSGWILFVSEWFSLIVFPLAFVQYMHYFLDPDKFTDIVLKILFVLIFTLINLKGGKITSESSSLITVLKIIPLALLIVLSIGWVLVNNSSAITDIHALEPTGIKNFNEVILLVFWAFAGFEMSVLPSEEIANPKKNIPRGIIFGILFIVLFYVLVNLSVFLILPEKTIIGSELPLAESISTILGNKDFGLIIIGGGILSISGIMLATIFELSHLLQKMAQDGFFVKILAKEYGKNKVPVWAIIMQSIVALILSLFMDIASVVTFSVVVLALVYLITGLANWKLHSMAKKNSVSDRIVSVLTVLFSIFLLLQASMKQYLLTLFVVVIGVVWYFIRRDLDNHNNHKSS